MKSLYKEYHADGETVVLQIPFKHGKKHGLLEKWRSPGKKDVDEPYIDGKLHGIVRAWHDDGKLRTEGAWVMGKREGILVEWTQAGERRETDWIDGQVVFHRGGSNSQSFIWKMRTTADRRTNEGALIYDSVAKFEGIFGKPTMFRNFDGGQEWGLSLFRLQLRHQAPAGAQQGGLLDPRALHLHPLAEADGTGRSRAAIIEAEDSSFVRERGPMIVRCLRQLRWRHSRRVSAVLVLLSLVVLAHPGRADDPPGRLTPGQREALEVQAVEVNRSGMELYDRGEYGPALEKMKEGLLLIERIYPKDEFPQGHRNLATSLNNLGFLLRAQGAYDEARGYLDRALRMRQALYPRDKYPQGHPDLASSLNNVAYVCESQGAYGEARAYYRQALAMEEALYPRDKYPQGHTDLALTLTGLGALLNAQGEPGEARGYLERALTMYQALYPRDKYPRGHSDLALIMSNLGLLLKDQHAPMARRRRLPRADVADGPGPLSPIEVSAGTPPPGHQPEQYGHPVPGRGRLRPGAALLPGGTEDVPVPLPREPVSSGASPTGRDPPQPGRLAGGPGYPRRRSGILRTCAEDAPRRSIPRTDIRKATPSWPTA